MGISHCYWHLVVTNGNFTLLLTSSGQEWQFHIATDIKWSRMAISHCYWHLVVRNGNFTMLVTSSGQNDKFPLLMSWSSGEEWQFQPLLLILEVKNGNFTLLFLTSSGLWMSSNFPLLLTSSGQEWQFHTPYWPPGGQEWNFKLLLTWVVIDLLISYCYWHLVVKNGNYPIATDI